MDGAAVTAQDAADEYVRDTGAMPVRSAALAIGVELIISQPTSSWAIQTLELIMLNSMIASRLYAISQLTSLEGGAKFRALAFAKGARIVSEMSDPIESANLDEIEGIGASLKQVIAELVASKGKTCKRLRELEKSHPPQVLELTLVSGIGAITAYKLYREYRVKSLDHLFQMLKSGKVPDKKQTLIAAVKDAISKRDSGMDRLPISWVYPSVAAICRELRKLKGVVSAEPAGSVRRFKDDVGDCDILVSVKTASAKERVFSAFTALTGKEDRIVLGPQKARIRLPINGYPFQIDLLVVPRREWGAALLYFTGSKDLNIEMRKIAISKGWKLSEHGLFDQRGNLIAARTEEEIFARLGMRWLPPELRESPIPNRLPKSLIRSKSDIVKDLHTHTHWSDGVDSPQDMIETAIKLGLCRIAITDHSYLIKSKFREYVAALKKLQRQYRNRIDVLVGAEVDIKKDGSLGLDEAQLRQLDFVVGSIHHNHKENVEARLIAAASSGFVHMIGHPTGRDIGNREIPECDWSRVFSTCYKYGVGLEINPNRNRLDLPPDLVRLAKSKGCKFAINTDAHSKDHLGKIDYGIKIATRAGLTQLDLYESPMI